MTGQALVDEQETVEQESVEHLDFDVACCSPHERRAALWLVCLRCRAHFPYCGPCEQVWALVAPTFPLVMCVGCHAIAPGALWREAFDVVPIGGS